ACSVSTATRFTTESRSSSSLPRSRDRTTAAAGRAAPARTVRAAWCEWCGTTRRPSSGGRRPVRIPDDFPQVPVRILEVAGVAAPERVGGRLDDPRPGAGRPSHHGVDIRARPDVVPEAETCRRRFRDGQTGVEGEVLPAEQREPQPTGEVEERHRAVLALPPDNPLGRQTESVAVEPHRTLEIRDAERNDADDGIHGN